MLKQNLYVICLTFIVSFIGFGCGSSVIQEAKKEVSPTVEAAPTPPTNKEPITIAAGGDIMMASTFPNETRMPPNDGKDTFTAVAPIFQKADIAFGNLEGPIVDGGVSAKCGNRPNCFAFRTPTRYGKYLKEAGFDILSLANNHAADFGDNGRNSTRKVLDELGIKHAGSDKDQFAMTTLEVKGKKIAFIAFATNSITPNVNDLVFAKQLVEKANKQADIVVVSFHGGAEGSGNTRVPQRTEIFFGEQRGNLPLFSKTVIDAGADLVLGHGPHVLRGMEIYKDRLIHYSLGNFATYGWFQIAGATAETMVLEVKLDADGKFIEGKINPFVLRDRGILTADSTKSAISTVRKLSQLDFPNSAPKIADDGTITK
jgi:poly-gamma-glutamate capsule biosynthesis protein CapA/YwtB (metallophosphatase superfamily)